MSAVDDLQRIDETLSAIPWRMGENERSHLRVPSGAPNEIFWSRMQGDDAGALVTLRNALPALIEVVRAAETARKELLEQAKYGEIIQARFLFFIDQRLGKALRTLEEALGE